MDIEKIIIKVSPAFLAFYMFFSLLSGCQSRAVLSDSGTKKLPEMTRWESGGYFEGDIILNDADGTQSAAIVGNNYRWPKAQVPYVISSDFSDAEKRVIIDEAMNEFHKSTCIRFVPKKWTNRKETFISIKKTGGGCYSKVGKQQAEEQIVSLDDTCIHRGTVMHELMHVVGFWHEQSRTDRDDFVTIHVNNILPYDRHNFEKYDSTRVNLLNTTYDSKSLMHYNGYAFALNRSLPTITNKDGSPVQPNENGFTQTDILELNRLYNCTKDQTITPTSSGGDELVLKEWNNGQVLLAIDCDFVGQHDIIEELSSSEECGELCIAKSWCTKFTWVLESYCHLKIGLTVAYEHKGAVCGWIVKRTEPSHSQGRSGSDQWTLAEKQEKEHRKMSVFLKKAFLRAPLTNSLLSAAQKIR